MFTMSYLYKFRTLASCSDLDRIKNLITNGKFWFSPLWDQNDSMEAIYRPAEICPTQELLISPRKMRTLICSFSSCEGLHHPLVWAHYACGFKGLAIEVELDAKINAHKVIYQDDPRMHSKKCTIEDTFYSIITSKSKMWEYESEFRVTQENSESAVTGVSCEVGTIRSIILGAPYKMISNTKEVYENSYELKTYAMRAKEIRDLARIKNIITKIAFLTFTPSGPSVVIENDIDDCFWSQHV